MDDVDLGDARAHETTDSSGSRSDDEYDASDDLRDADARPEGLSQRLRGSLQRRVTPLVGNLRHSIATSTGADAPTSRLRSAMQRIRGGRADGRTNQTADDAADEDAPYELRKSASAVLRAAAGLALVDEHKLVLLGHAPLVQPQDDVLFLERPAAAVAYVMMRRGDVVRIRSPEDPSQSWLCALAEDKASADADVLPLAAPFPGALVPDAEVHFVPRECLPRVGDDADEDRVGDLRSSLDGWRPSADDADVSTDDEAAGFASPAPRTSAARDKAAAFYETLKTRKARLRTSSADYKDKLKASKVMLSAAGQASKEKLAVASQISKEKLAVAGQVSKEKLASVVSKEKLAAAGQVSKEKLAVASQVSKEKLAVAGQASKEKLAVAGQASKLKMQSWTSSAKSSFKAKMAQRAEQKAAAHAASVDASGPEDLAKSPIVDPDVFTIEDNDDDDDNNNNQRTAKPQRRIADVSAEEAQLRRELDDC